MFILGVLISIDLTARKQELLSVSKKNLWRNLLFSPLDCTSCCNVVIYGFLQLGLWWAAKMAILECWHRRPCVAIQLWSIRSRFICAITHFSEPIQWAHVVAVMPFGNRVPMNILPYLVPLTARISISSDHVRVFEPEARKQSLMTQASWRSFWSTSFCIILSNYTTLFFVVVCFKLFILNSIGTVHINQQKNKQCDMRWT